VILGVGSDMVDIRRIAATLERQGERFVRRCFTETERARCERRPQFRAASYAKRFAAKEACAKALGTGFRRGVFWRDMGVVNLGTGQPTLLLTGGAAERLATMVPRGYSPNVHVSLTDDHPWAQSFVVISAIPVGIVPEGAFGA
jgi:holo-[acyl-carrier protein] synthase